MSIVRINPPGQPVRYIDLGPARGRVSAGGFVSMGGPLSSTTALPLVYTRVATNYGQRVIDQEPDRPRCMYPLRHIGEPCWRRPGHKDTHRSREAVEADRARRKRP